MNKKQSLILMAGAGLLSSLTPCEEFPVLRFKGIIGRADKMSMSMMIGKNSLSFRPMTNAERQRNFRNRNPGYYNKYYARLKAEVERQNEVCRREFYAKLAAQKAAELALLDPETSGLNVMPEIMV